MKKIRILIVDDHQLFREGLANLLSESEMIDIIGQGENGKVAVEMAEKLSPDIIIMDIGMPIINGIEATKIIKSSMPEIKVIALSMHSEKTYVREMLEAGASGYFLKNCTYQHFIEGIQRVDEGKMYLSETITEILVHDYLGKAKDEPPHKLNQLSPRENEVLTLFASGKTTKEIASILFVSIKTIGTHKQNILEKLELKTTADLVRYAIKNKLINID